MLFSLLGFRFSFLVLGLGLGILLHCEVASELLCPDERDMHKNPPAPAFFGEINTLHFEGLALHLLGPGPEAFEGLGLCFTVEGFAVAFGLSWSFLALALALAAVLTLPWSQVLLA